LTDILADLNPAQREAVCAPEGPVLVVAGAGSGKTRVLTTRIAWLLQQDGLSPAEILAFTFTNRAAREMRKRVDRLVAAGPAPSWIGTFHATGVKILRRDGEAIGVDRRFVIYDSDDSLRVVKRATTRRELDLKQFPPAVSRAVISRWKNEDRAPAAARAGAAGFVEQKIAEVYRAYEEELQACNALDFDDLVLRTVHLLEQVPEVRQKYARRFRHVLVDEFQDTNPLQLILVKALCSCHGNLFVVGDDDQAIYSWRGACVENMLNFEQYFPGTTLLRLEQNYRSTGNILAAANAVIAHNKDRKGKNLWTSGSAGDNLRLDETADAEDEAARLVTLVQQELTRGCKRGDLAVLYRTNAQSRLLEDALRRANIPYQIVGSVQFYERREVRDLLAYLKLVANPQDRISALRVINVPRRGIGAATVARLIGLADENELTLGETAAEPGLIERELAPAACRRVRSFFALVTAWRAAEPETQVPALLERIIQETGYGSFLETDDPATARARSENVNELINAAYSFAEGADGGRLAQFLEQVALVSDVDALQDTEGLVRLMTIHTAKGLEFPVVMVSGCEEELLPHAASAAEESGLEEERRLFYVAVTRARRRVYLLYARRRRRFGVYEDCLPSRFLGEIPGELVDRHQSVAVGPGLFTGGPSGRRVGRAAASRAGAPSGSGRLARPEPVSAWDRDVSQEETRFFPGQTVFHSSFGNGVVQRVEGTGDDLLVTVEFPAAGRKHLLPRFAPLRPVD